MREKNEKKAARGAKYTKKNIYFSYLWGFGVLGFWGFGDRELEISMGDLNWN